MATKCEDWETKRKSKIGNFKKGNCFHEKTLPSELNFESTNGKVTKHKKKWPEWQKQYVYHKTNGFGDETKTDHRPIRHQRADGVQSGRQAARRRRIHRATLGRVQGERNRNSSRA